MRLLCRHAQTAEEQLVSVSTTAEDLSRPVARAQVIAWSGFRRVPPARPRAGTARRPGRVPTGQRHANAVAAFLPPRTTEEAAPHPLSLSLQQTIVRVFLRVRIIPVEGDCPRVCERVRRPGRKRGFNYRPNT